MTYKQVDKFMIANRDRLKLIRTKDGRRFRVTGLGDCLVAPDRMEVRHRRDFVRVPYDNLASIEVADGNRRRRRGKS